MEEIRDDVVFYLETTTEELMTIKPQPRIAKETTSAALNQTSTTSLGSFRPISKLIKFLFDLFELNFAVSALKSPFISSTETSTTPKITKKKHFKKRRTTPETSTQAKNTTTETSSV